MRRRYGGHFANCPNFEASVADNWVMPPSRPIEAPVAMLIRADAVLTDSVRNGSRPSPATTTSSRSLEPCGPTRRKPQYKIKPAPRPPKAGTSNRCVVVSISAVSTGSPVCGQKNPLHHFASIIKEQVHQPAQHAHHPGQDQMERFLLENQLLAPA